MKRAFRRAVALGMLFCGGAYALAVQWWGFAPLSPTGHGLPGGQVVAMQGFQRKGETHVPLSYRVQTPAAAPAVAAESTVAPVLISAPPTRIRLDVPLVLQLPELPNGCEATSLAMALQFLGLEADKMALAYGGIPRQDFAQQRTWLEGGDPNKVYVGDPAGYGYYCFAPVIARAARRQLAEADIPGAVQNETGASEADLEGFLASGAPVIAWITVDDAPPRYNPNAAWLISGTEEQHTPYSNLHVVVLTGYNEDVFYLNDPLGRLTEMPRELFMDLFRQMGRQAVVIT